MPLDVVKSQLSPHAAFTPHPFSRESFSVFFCKDIFYSKINHSLNFQQHIPTSKALRLKWVNTLSAQKMNHNIIIVLDFKVQYFMYYFVINK